MNIFENEQLLCEKRLGATTSAEAFVEEVLQTAQLLILSDPSGYFLYKDPKVQITPKKGSIVPDSAYDLVAETEDHKAIKWVSIHDFSFNAILNQIRDFIMLWNLSPTTKFVVASAQEKLVYRELGTSFLMTALFSKPTSRCPNPLPVAKVHFYVNVSEILPIHFPVMVVYRFEGYLTDFYALGEKQILSWNFQRYFIDSIIERKMLFYAKLFECRHPKKIIEEEINVEEEGEQEEDIADYEDNSNNDEMSLESIIEI